MDSEPHLHTHSALSKCRRIDAIGKRHHTQTNRYNGQTTYIISGMILLKSLVAALQLGVRHFAPIDPLHAAMDASICARKFADHQLSAESVHVDNVNN